MTWIPWLLFGLAVVWHFAAQQLSHRKRNHLANFVVYLLLSDSIRSAHKANFQEWIAQAKAPDAMALTIAAHGVIENAANRLAAGKPANPGTSSTLGAHAMLWRTKQGDKI